MREIDVERFSYELGISRVEVLRLEASDLLGVGFRSELPISMPVRINPNVLTVTKSFNSSYYNLLLKNADLEFENKL